MGYQIRIAQQHSRMGIVKKNISSFTLETQKHPLIYREKKTQTQNTQLFKITFFLVVFSKTWHVFSNVARKSIRNTRCFILYKPAIIYFFSFQMSKLQYNWPRHYFHLVFIQIKKKMSAVSFCKLNATWIGWFL